MVETVTSVSQISPQMLFLGTFAAFLVGLAGMFWGRRLPREGDWLIGLGLLPLLLVAILSWMDYLQGNLQPVPWLRGWIAPRVEQRAVHVGILQDFAGLTMALLAVVMGLFYLINRVARGNPRGSDFAAAALGVSGVALAWMALTPWLAYIGVGIATLGGFGALAGQSSDGNTRYAKERIFALLLTSLGAAGLISTGAGLIWSKDLAQWPDLPLVQTAAGFLVAGILFQLQFFPLMGWVSSDSDHSSESRILFPQVFPAWAAFATLVRLEPVLRNTGILVPFGWFALVSAILAVIAGLVQTDLKKNVAYWLISVHGIAVAGLCFSGPLPAIAILIGSCLAVAGFCLFESSAKPGEKNFWTGFLAFLVGAFASGFPGSVMCFGLMTWLGKSISNSALTSVGAICIFFTVALIWRAVWLFLKSGRQVQPQALLVMPAFLLLILGSAWFWAGTLTGGALPAGTDAMGLSLLSRALGGESLVMRDEDFAAATWLMWGSVAMGILFAYWTTGREQDRMVGFSAKFPGFNKALSENYSFDRFVEKLLNGVDWVGRQLHHWVDTETWNKQMPRLLTTVIDKTGSMFSKASEGIANTLGSTLKHGVETPAKFFQIVQSGDMQWYLFLMIGSGVAILVHFLRFHS